MDYYELAEQMVNLQTSLHQLPISQELSTLGRGVFFALNYLILHEPAVYPKDLSRGMAVSSARVAALLNHMEAEGLIRRTPDPQDSRQVLVSLTEQGVQAIHRKRQEILDTVAETLQELGPEDAQALLRIQERIMQNFLRRVQSKAQTAATARKETSPQRHE